MLPKQINTALTGNSVILMWSIQGNTFETFATKATRSRLQAVLAVFAEAYNRFGVAKLKWRTTHDKGEVPFSVIHFL
jgi:hypothetical protein